jgi:hypothetical protein
MPLLDLAARLLNNRDVLMSRDGREAGEAPQNGCWMAPLEDDP